jgi:hypothetical protein
MKEFLIIKHDDMYLYVCNVLKLERNVHTKIFIPYLFTLKKCYQEV